jgi:hypothetical protein
MMTREDRQEALSLAYIQAVAACAGMTYSVRSKDYGIDITLHEVVRRDNYLRESGYDLDIQVKSSISVAETRTTLAYDLPVKAYHDLRAEVDQVRILALFVMPADEASWLRQTRAKLELRECMFWTSLRGYPPVRNRSSVRVTIPKRQVFTPASLRRIMDRIRTGETP